MTELLKLAERVEAAEGPDRELGREVLRACGWKQSTHGYFLGPLTGWTSPDLAIYFDDDDFVRCRHDPTASLDAAMTLVPDDTEVNIHRYQRDKANGRRFTANVTHWPEPPIPLPLTTTWHGRGASFALALVAAALRARAA